MQNSQLDARSLAGSRRVVISGPSGSIRTTDIVEREAVGALGLEFEQLSAGRFDSNLRFVRTAHLVAYRERSRSRMALAGATRSDLVTFGADLPGQHPIRWCGRTLGPGRVGVASPGAEMHAIVPPDHDHWVVMARSEALLLLAEEFEVDLRAFFETRVQDCAPALLDRAASRLVSIIERPDLQQACRAGSTLDEIERSIVLVLLSTIAGRGRAPSRPPGNASLRGRALRRALERIHASSERLGIHELACEVGVSQRTLEYAFRDALDVTPVRYLRLHRMNAARRELSTADPGKATVTEIAARWGLNELGRFAVEYKKLFGESPRDTLRAPGRAAAVGALRLATLT